MPLELLAAKVAQMGLAVTTLDELLLASIIHETS